MGKTISVNGEQYEEIPAVANAASKVIADMHIRLGRPTDPFSESGQKMMDIIIAVWQDLYPRDAYQWLEDRKDYQKNEMTISEQSRKRTGRSLASYPYPIYQLMQKVFKGFDPVKRENCLKMVKLWPIFRFANKA